MRPVPDLEDINRDDSARRHGTELFDGAEAISQTTVDAVAAVLSRVAGRSEYWAEVMEGYGERMVADAGARHLGGIGLR